MLHRVHLRSICPIMEDYWSLLRLRLCGLGWHLWRITNALDLLFCILNRPDCSSYPLDIVLTKHELVLFRLLLHHSSLLIELFEHVVFAALHDAAVVHYFSRIVPRDII